MYPLIRRVLFALDSERAHAVAARALWLASRLPPISTLLRRRYTVSDPALAQDLWGIRFANPVGLAAGWDKNARYFRALSLLGFGSIEVGTVTARPQPGNPRPRVFRLPADEALINRMGFPNDGAAAIAPRLAKRSTIPLGVNIGRSKVVSNEQAIDDYLATLNAVWEHASYIAVNVSSPNTPELRALQARDRLGPLVGAIRDRLRQLAAAQRQPPLLLKISPDLDEPELDGICEVLREYAVDGVIATNTTLARGGLRSSLASIPRPEEGGLSGRPLTERTIAIVAALYARLGPSIPIVAAGGIDSADAAWRAIAAGARLIQVYTALIYQGPGLVRAINRGLVERLRQLGVASVADVAGRGGELLQATEPPAR